MGSILQWIIGGLFDAACKDTYPKYSQKGNAEENIPVILSNSNTK